MPLTKKRVLHFIDSDGVYGAERVILNLSQQLKTSETYTPVVGCIVANAHSHNALFDTAQQLGLEAVKIPIANARILFDIPKAATQIQALNIDLIHSHGYKPSVFGFIITLLKKIPIMATCHLWFEPAKGPLKMRALISLEKRFYRWFPAVVGVSEPIRKMLLSFGVKPQNTFVVQNGVDVPEHSIPATELVLLRQELGLDPHSFCVLNTARLSKQKAQWILIDAAAQLKASTDNIQIIIVGEGPLAQELHEQIKQLQLEKQVRILGFRRDVNKLLALADAFALPSIDEGMPMSLLEAAAASKPIISTLVGDIGKLIVHESTGLVIPTNDATALSRAILTLKNSPALAAQLAQAAHQSMLTNYSSKAMSHRYQEIYTHILADV
jgi:glycosyltransferase involved in cell wall biosynthesis